MQDTLSTEPFENSFALILSQNDIPDLSDDTLLAMEEEEDYQSMLISFTEIDFDLEEQKTNDILSHLGSVNSYIEQLKKLHQEDVSLRF